jgi:hypothetical protein
MLEQGTIVASHTFQEKYGPSWSALIKQTYGGFISIVMFYDDKQYISKNILWEARLSETYLLCLELSGSNQMKSTHHIHRTSS